MMHDLTTFGGRLAWAMKQRNVSSQALSQFLIREGFSASRANIDQWKKISDDTWRGKSEVGAGGTYQITQRGTGLKDSRAPYPAEILLITQRLRINGFWLFVGGTMPWERPEDLTEDDPDLTDEQREVIADLPTSKEDLEKLWAADKKRRAVMNAVMNLPDDAHNALFDLLSSLGLVELPEDD